MLVSLQLAMDFWEIQRRAGGWTLTPLTMLFSTSSMRTSLRIPTHVNTDSGAM
jgi:hypothetical protein